MKQPASDQQDINIFALPQYCQRDVDTRSPLLEIGSSQPGVRQLSPVGRQQESTMLCWMYFYIEQRKGPYS